MSLHQNPQKMVVSGRYVYTYKIHKVHMTKVNAFSAKAKLKVFCMNAVQKTLELKFMI